jgi:aspartyl/asparaginyl beta-hydroxylase (cupin superfamily)
MAAMAAGQFATAQDLLRQALAAEPQRLAFRLNLAASQRASGQIEEALATLEDALLLDPRAFPVLLMKASLLERAGRDREAVAAYAIALSQAPPDDRLDAPTLRAVLHGRALAEKHNRDLQAEFAGKVDVTGLSASQARRMQAFMDLLTGRRRNYRQEPVGYFYPGLPAIEFWEREEFPWLEAFEAATADVQAELYAVLDEPAVELTPYIDYPDNAPLDQWEELNHSQRWSAFHMLEFGRRVEANCRRCPKTLAALSGIPQPVNVNRSPSAMFSVLEPHTHIPPHTGISNTRLVCHLPLIVPPDCRFRVGNETRPWRAGEAWVFDDTIDHEAWNDSDERRVILLCDVWNPRIPEDERVVISQVMATMDAFNGQAVGGGL